jgi:phage-related protein
MTVVFQLGRDVSRAAAWVQCAWHSRRVARTQAIYYRDARGGEPVDDFINALPGKQAAKIDDHITEHLNGKRPSDPPPVFPVSSQVASCVSWVRFADRRYRILYQRSGNLLVLLHAFEKATGSIADADIELAKTRMSDFKRRMDAKPRRRPRAAGKDAPPKSR